MAVMFPSQCKHINYERQLFDHVLFLLIAHWLNVFPGTLWFFLFFFMNCWTGSVLQRQREAGL